MIKFIKSLSAEQTEELKKTYYLQEARRSILEQVLTNNTSDTNSKMTEYYMTKYEEASIAHQDAFLMYESMVPEPVRFGHEIKTMANFIEMRFEVTVLCDCDVIEMMLAAGFTILE